MLVAQATELLIIVCIYKNEYVEVDFLNNLKVEICYVYISELGWGTLGRQILFSLLVQNQNIWMLIKYLEAAFAVYIVDLLNQNLY